MKNRIKLVAWVVLVLSFVAVPLLGGCAGTAVTNETLEAGEEVVAFIHLADMTGPISWQGHYLSGTWWCRLQNANEGHELGEGYKATDYWSDTRYDVAKALADYKHMLTKTPRPIGVYNYNSGVVDAMWPTFNKDKIVHVGTSVGGGACIEEPGYTFVSCSQYDEQFCAMMEWLKLNWDKPEPIKVAYLTWDNSYGRSIMSEGALDYLDELGIEVVATEFLPVGAVDATTQLMKIKAAGANVVTSNWVAQPQSIVLKDAARLGMLPEVQFTCATEGVTEGMIEVAGETTEGLIYYGAFINPNQEGAPQRELVDELMFEKFEKHITGPTDYNGWVVGSILVEGAKRALEDVGYENLSGETLKTALEGMAGFEPSGVIASLEYSPTNRIAFKEIQISTVENGTFKVLDSGISVPDLWSK